MANSYLKVDEISKKFGKHSVLKGISFDIKKGEFMSFLGPSGCGKSTLIRIIAGLENPDMGRILLNNNEITSVDTSKRNFGIVFQSYALFPNLTAYQNIEYGIRMKKLSRAEVKERIMNIIKLVDLEKSMHKYPAQMSGGQQQRVALARVLVLEPAILLLDEPLSALDAKVRGRLRKELKSIQEKTGITTIMVTHDQEEALTMSDRIAVMHDGEIVQIGRPEDIYNTPINPFVADFIGEINFIAEGDAIKAIRPEHIELSDTSDNRSITTVVENCEFMGSSYRITLKPERVSAGNKNFLTMDVDTSLFKRMNLYKSSILSVRLPEDKVITYSN